MSEGLKLPKFSLGVGDRFAHQAKAQLAACILAADAGVEVVPVWNKSNREHMIIGSEPSQTRAAADAAVKELGWTKPYFLDADHINLKTVGRFLEPCDFFTLDVADLIGQPADPKDVEAFVKRHPELVGTVTIPHIDEPFKTDVAFVTGVANKFLAAVQDAGRIYRFLVEKKGAGKFIAEVSMDETDYPQTPVELLIILAAISDEKIPIQTIAPKFTGRFNKGVDYVGDVAQFTKEFNEDLATIAFAIKTYGLPDNLKLSIHSGSDKFSIYKAVHDAVKKFDAGVHMKTAGTTWLEELIGLAEAGGNGLAIAKEVYAEAYAHSEELCAPYATVIDIDPTKLPQPEEVNGWTSEQYTSALRHEQGNKAYNQSFRQLLHVGFKVAAKLGDRYLKALEANEAVVAKNVTTNLFERHIRPVFLGK
ncbi:MULTISPECIES: tagaturonate epimerase family protein [Acidobacteriaceae]|uniref:tagaturonate epimerase family protein n=1 Tax=Acidobacteriaceae TaxID=204434 RepID=UPI00131CE932|nr:MULTISPECIES: tagaturonate epimerase family protein [Acidobacteriaceae]MDW5266867.1 tagaturonate epimerase family protein [Edaphobacter sp.]